MLREMRYFQPWPQGRNEDFILPRSMQGRQGSNKVPIGDSVLSMADVRCPTFIVFLALSFVTIFWSLLCPIFDCYRRPVIFV